MNRKKITSLLCIISVMLLFSNTLNAQLYHEQYRNQIHFSPKAHWMNDPNGMVYNDGVYHLFFQYYPGSTVWGPMHWGHATSTDMIHWKEKAVAIYPDSLGYIFSGSAVIDKNNTSGFGKNGKAPMVAIFTQHDTVGEKNGKDDFQTQSVAYSLDDGETWTKYAHNPVIKNPGIKDFRDPKVIWYEAEKKWIMILAVKDHVSFYSSLNLKEWTKESDFGNNIGAHGGVWECPDLFILNNGNKKFWIVTVSINPGAPNGGSGTQYFVGDFNGKTFTTKDTTAKWIDYGPDDYAGVTWSNTGDKKYFLGWMSNWDYAEKVPSKEWRSAMTIPRTLSLEKINNAYYILSEPVKSDPQSTAKNLSITNNNVSEKFAVPYTLHLNVKQLDNFECMLSNSAGDKLFFGFDKKENNFYIDRTNAGKTDFYKGFAGRFYAPRFAQTDSCNITVVVDNASIELFADNGATAMTAIYFSDSPLNSFWLKPGGKFQLSQVSYYPLKSIWH